MRVVYAIWRDRGSDLIFVAHPSLKGLYLRTHPCVVHVVCSACKAGVGVPCQGRNGEWKSATHAARRESFRKRRKAGS